MHLPDRHLARARSKDTRKDERRVFVRAARRAGKISPRDVEDEHLSDD